MFGKKPRKELRTVPLSREPDLSGGNDVGAAFSEATSSLYFYLEGSSEIGKLSFDAKAYRAVRTDCIPYIDKEFSFLLEIVGSDWPTEMDNWVYLDSRNESWFLEAKKSVKHYVIAGNDIYHEFLAYGFTEHYLPIDCVEHKLAILILGGNP